MKFVLLSILLGAGLGSYCQNFSLTLESNDSSAYQLIPLIADRNYSIPAIELGTVISKPKHYSIPIERAHFALLKSEGREFRIMIAPNEKLDIKIGPTLQFSGSLKSANELLQKLGFDSIPFYQKLHGTENIYRNLGYKELLDQVLEVQIKEVEVKKALIQKTKVKPVYKAMLSMEVEYLAQCYLYDLGRIDLRNSSNPATDSFLLNVMKWLPIPSAETLSNSVYGGMITDFRIQYSINSIAIGRKKDPEAMKKRISDTLGLSFDSITGLINKYGERYIVDWLYSKKHFKPNVAEKILFNKIIDAYNDHWNHSVAYLSDVFQKSYPQSSYLEYLKSLNRSIELTLKSNETNLNIHFISDSSTKSFASLLEKYRGSYVYLDFWGTWCGPCRMEIPYAKKIKERYKGPDLKFVYLDLDEEDKDQFWKNFVRYNGMEGDHYRFNRRAMEDFWKPIEAAGGKTNLYPTYVIIDPMGNILFPNAARPSEKEKLYEQLDPLILKK